MDTIDNCRYQVLMIFLLAVFLVEVLCVAYLWIFLQVRQNSNHMAVGFLYLLIAAYYSEHMNNNILDNSTNDIFR